MTDIRQQVLQAWLAQQFLQELRNRQQQQGAFQNALDERVAHGGQTGDMGALNEGDQIMAGAMRQQVQPAATETMQADPDPGVVRKPTIGDPKHFVENDLGKSQRRKVQPGAEPIKGRRR